jgi:DNA-binding beta-propeller fold protein YncE
MANTGGNNILVFSPSYSELGSKTITAGINTPMSLAFDSIGNLWVANNGASNGGANGSISQYTAGVQNAGATITDGIDSPFSIAVDGINNLFVENNHANVTVYEPTSPFDPPTSSFVVYYAQETSFFGVFASPQGVVFLGTSGDFDGTPLTMYGTELYFFNGQTLNNNVGGEETLAMTSDASGNVYLANTDGTVDKLLAAGGILSTVLQSSFPPTGIAVDSKRGRIYLSDYDDSQIAVYDLTGTLLKVIN